METHAVPPTPEQACAALAEAEGVALSATPWPTWFAAVLTVYLAGLPFATGGVLADDWLLSHGLWLAVLMAGVAVFSALLAVAARQWRDRTGVALRWDVLAAADPAAGGPAAGAARGAVRLPGDGAARLAGRGSLAVAAMSVGFHRVFVRMHRRGV